MPENTNESRWREEFERLGEMQVYDNVKQCAIYNDEAKRQAAFRWLGEVAAVRRARESRSYKYVRWTFCHSACNFDPLSRGIGVQN